MKLSKKVALLLPMLPLACIPFLSTSCAPLLTAKLKVFDKNNLNIGKHYDDIANCKTSLGTLLNGTTHYNNGNYVIIFATSANANSDNWFNGSFFNNRSDLNDKTFKNDDKIEKTSFIDELSTHHNQNMPQGQDYKFLTYLEVDKFINHGFSGDGKSGWDRWQDTNQYKGATASPWAKYDDDDNKQDDKLKSGKWVRNDGAAKDLRSLSSTINKLFSISIESNVSSHNPFVGIQWVKGRPVSSPLSFSSTTSASDFFKSIDDNYNASTNWKK